MSITSQAGSVYTDITGLDQLKHSLKGDSVADLKVAAQQFEAVFIQQMLKTMREANLAEGMFDSSGGDFYVEMLDKQLSLNLSQGKGIGLTEIIVKQMSNTLNLKPDQSEDKSAAIIEKQTGNPLPVIQSGFPIEIKPTLNSASVATNVAAAVGKDKVGETKPSEGFSPIDLLNTENTKNITSPETFIKTLWPLAVNASKEIGVAPQLLVAQAALETGWGQYIARQEDGQSSHNLFNIKAGANWQGDTVTLATMELKNGASVKEYAAFRVYDSYNTSFDDYVALIKQNPRYQEALKQAANSAQYATALQKAGYATDPAYADKIVRIANSIPLKI